MFDSGRDEGYAPFGSGLWAGSTRAHGYNTAFATITPLPVNESYVIKQAGGRDLWMNATAHAAAKRGKKRVAVASLNDSPSFGQTIEAPRVAKVDPKAKKGGALKTSIEPSELMDFENSHPVSKGHEPHSRLTNRIKLQLAGAIS
jgi:hypothetical protein